MGVVDVVPSISCDSFFIDVYALLDFDSNVFSYISDFSHFSILSPSSPMEKMDATKWNVEFINKKKV
jgi:hypothetical protein